MGINVSWLTRRRALKLVGIALAVVLVGAGAEAFVARFGSSAPELQRPDLLIAAGICVAVWLGGASSEEAAPDA